LGKILPALYTQQQTSHPRPLGELPTGVAGRIVAIRGGRELSRRLLGLGLRIGSEVRIEHRRGRGLVVSVGEGRIALAGHPNGGKSTLFDAIQALFFKPHSSRDKEVAALRPHAGGAPAVTIEIEADGTRYAVNKRWLQKPAATVHRDGTLIAQADAAEAWIEAQEPRVAAWARANGFSGALGSVLAVPGDDGRIERVLAGWGRPPIDSPRVRAIAAASEPLCLGVTKSGEPRHPLYLPRDAGLIRWPG